MKSHVSELIRHVSVWKSRQPSNATPQYMPVCDAFNQETIWESDIPHAISAGGNGQKVVATLNVNSDAVADLIVGFGTGSFRITSKYLDFIY